MELIPNNPWPELFRQARKSAFHLEVKDAYTVPAESEPFRRFLAGEPQQEYGKRAWTGLVEETAARGVAVSRVRVVTVPHSDYHRWLFSITGSNIDAGEDIRYLPRHLIDSSEVPMDDFWIFDSQKVAFNLVDQSGTPAGAAVTADPRVTESCLAVQARLWRDSIPYREYIAPSVNTAQ
ncbi:hypothetical protein D5S18_15875 [Nocardia panacis]|uniref:DUF6879 domain-containing protein n=1 Tax=Nocardia panacis TaxID=2340916 RepID=A0A3A4K7B4_9NOCA|nr:DUF6879 family protein [Nocardia panacis]RJO74894.1 hypothetical protein D5S18_15875 [Nocardia panacis]